MKTNDSSSSKSILKQAFSEIVREEAALLSDTPSQPRSVAFEQKMRRLFRRQRYLESPLFNTVQKRTQIGDHQESRMLKYDCPCEYGSKIQ